MTRAKIVTILFIVCARIRKLPQAQWEPAPRCGIDEAGIIYRRNALALVPAMDDDKESACILGQSLTAWPSGEDVSDRVLLCHGGTLMTNAVISQEANVVIECRISRRDYAHMSNQAAPRIPREMYPDRIGERLRLIREAHNLKPAEIADLLEIERTYWSRFERGHRAVSDEVAYLLTERFGVTLDFIILGRWDRLPYEVAERLRSAMSAKT